MRGVEGGMPAQLLAHFREPLAGRIPAFDGRSNTQALLLVVSPVRSSDGRQSAGGHFGRVELIEHGEAIPALDELLDDPGRERLEVRFCEDFPMRLSPG